MPTGWRNPSVASSLVGLPVSSSDSDSDTPLNPHPRARPPVTPLSSYAKYAASQPPMAPSLTAPRRPPIDPDPHRFQQFLFRLLPIGVTLCWLGTLVGLLIAWMWIDDAERYKWYIGSIPFVSNVGAVHKEWFATGAIWTAVFLVATIWSERYLRADRVLVEAMEERTLWVAIGVVDVLAALFGGASLVMLTWFDAFDHPELHNIYMICFIVGIVISGALQTAEVEHLWHEHPDREDLKQGTVLKIAFLCVSVTCALGYWLFYTLCDGDASRSQQCYRYTTAAAVLEWAACFVLVLYFATLVGDIWPAYRHAPIPEPVFANRFGVQGYVSSLPAPSTLEKGGYAGLGPARSLGSSRGRRDRRR